MERNLRKQREGIVTSNKMDKTITVEVLRRVKHPIYGMSLLQLESYNEPLLVGIQHPM